MSFEELFAKIYENSNLLNDLEQKARKLEKQFPKLQDSENKREHLVSQLNNMIIELYRITPVKIDYNRLMQGEEGIVSYLEIETIKNKKTGKRDPYIDTKQFSNKEITETIVNKLGEITSLLKKLN